MRTATAACISIVSPLRPRFREKRSVEPLPVLPRVRLLGSVCVWIICLARITIYVLESTPAACALLLQCVPNGCRLGRLAGIFFSILCMRCSCSAIDDNGDDACFFRLE